MKTILNKWFVGLFAAAALVAGGCSDPDGIVEELDVDRVFSPLNFEVLLENNVNATFSWTKGSGIENYQLDLQYENGESYYVATIPVEGDQQTMRYAMDELPGQTRFVANLYALSTNPLIDNSKPAVCTFQTGTEQLFLNDGVVDDADVTATTAIMRWMPGANVTHLAVDNGIGNVQLDATAKAEGQYQLTGLKTGTFYTVNLCRDSAVRGTVSFTASDKQEIALLEKGAKSVTIGWPATAAIDEVRISPAAEGGESFKLTTEEQAAHAYTISGLKSLTEYTITIYMGGVDCGSIKLQTLGQTTKWDFTTWEVQTFAAPTTINDLLINANAAATSGKEMYISNDPELGCNYLDLKGKSSNVGKAGQAPTDRTVAFSVDGEGVISIDCYANGAGRNFAVYVDALGTDTGKFEAPVKENRGKVFIPVTGFKGTTTLYIWTDATINHVYSIEWTEGPEAPGQFAEALATPEVTVTPAEATLGEAVAMEIAWTAVEHASSYQWTLKGATDAAGNAIGGTTTELKATVAAEVVAALAPGTYTAEVVAVSASSYLYKNSAAGKAYFVVSDLILAAPVVSVAPAKLEQGTAEAVVASWEAVNNAATYRVSFNGGEAVEQAETSYTIDAATVAALAVGQYTISVVAVPAAEDTERQESAAGVATLTIEEHAPVTPPSGNVPYHWDEAYFTKLHAQFGDNVEIFEDFSIEGLNFRAGGGKFKMKTSGGRMAINLQSSGSIDKCALWYTVGGPGTMKLTVRSGTSSEDRAAKVCIAGVALEEDFVGPGAEAKEYTIDCTSAKEGDEIAIYGVKAIFVFDIEWIPAEGGTPDPAPQPVVYEWGNDLFTELMNTYGSGVNVEQDIDLGNGLKFIAGGSKCKFGVNDGATRLQLGGSGNASKCVLQLTVAGPGTLDLDIAGTNSTDDRTAMVELDGAQTSADGYVAPNTTQPHAKHTIDCSAAQAGSVIAIYSKSSGINVFNIKWSSK